MTNKEITKWRQAALAYFSRAKIVLTDAEAEEMEIADFGLNEYEETGLAIVTYVNTSKVCAKEMVLLPGQTCPEHRHPDVAGEPGKEETFRCRYGLVYLYVPGVPTQNPACRPPEKRRSAYQVFHEVILRPGEQYTLNANTLHWFQGGPEGAVVSEFSTTSRDESDIFTDPAIKRV